MGDQCSREAVGDRSCGLAQSTSNTDSAARLLAYSCFDTWADRAQASQRFIAYARELALLFPNALAMARIPRKATR